MVLFILRLLFVVLASLISASFADQIIKQITDKDSDISVVYTLGVYFLMAFGGLIFSSIAVFSDMIFKEKKLQAFSGVFLGLLAGMLVAYILSYPVNFIIEVIFDAVRTFYLAGNITTGAEVDFTLVKSRLQTGSTVLLGLFCSYFAISLILQTRDDFRFVIPYIEFKRQIRGNKPIVLDTSVLIDGRICEVTETRILQGPMLIPQFVIEELQTLSDSADKLKRSRGRRGLEMLKTLQSNKKLDLAIHEGNYPSAEVDLKLLAMADEMDARIMTTDYNLQQVAQVRNTDVINLHELAAALKPAVLPGESLNIKIIKPGESGNQGVGYLEDGTMVVVENAKHLIDEYVNLSVTSSLQTSAGRMVFGRLDTDLTESAEGISHGGAVKRPNRYKKK